ncbi:MAG: hypothetical protein IMHGJWDQ_000401 [Candidatus Fervidibacter sp.]
MQLKLGHSPDADDAFMFYAMTTGKLRTEPIVYEHCLHDIQTLNEMLLRGQLDISAVSVHACAYLTRRYALMTCGASMGDGYGPLVVANPSFLPNLSSAKAQILDALRRYPIAVPGTLTTAFLALRLCVGLFPFVVMPFDRILDAVGKGEVPFGLLIHEGQLTYTDVGLVKVLDLGEWWKQETGLPLPLGVNVIRKDLPLEVQRTVVAHLRESLRYALEHRDEALAYALQFARGMDKERAAQFVGMYVNELTVEMGDVGKLAILTLLERAAQFGLAPHGSPQFIGD